MNNKVSYLIVIMIIGLSFVFLTTNNQNSQLIDESDNSDITLNEELNDMLKKDKTIENDVITLDNIVFEDDVQIENLVKLQNSYYAYGSKDDQPYIQLVDQSNSIKIKTDIKDFNGAVIDLSDNSGYITASILTPEGKVISQNFFVSKDEIIPFYKKQLEINYYKGVAIEPEYLVIHETANTNVGADADAHYRYWSTNQNANASTHYVVDSTQIYQMLELNQAAWHVGDNKGYSNITNMNTIGIEIAVNSDGNYDQARQHTIELSIKIMKELDMDISQLKMHNDASGKLDPITMLDSPSLWEDFVYQVEQGLKGN